MNYLKIASTMNLVSVWMYGITFAKIIQQDSSYEAKFLKIR